MKFQCINCGADLTNKKNIKKMNKKYYHKDSKPVYEVLCKCGELNKMNLNNLEEI